MCVHMCRKPWKPFEHQEAGFEAELKEKICDNNSKYLTQRFIDVASL